VGFYGAQVGTDFVHITQKLAEGFTCLFTKIDIQHDLDMIHFSVI